MRPIATTVASGSVSSLVIALARDLRINHPGIPDLGHNEICPPHRHFGDPTSTWSGRALEFRVLVGIFAGPLKKQPNWNGIFVRCVSR